MKQAILKDIDRLIKSNQLGELSEYLNCTCKEEGSGGRYIYYAFMKLLKRPVKVLSHEEEVKRFMDRATGEALNEQDGSYKP